MDHSVVAFVVLSVRLKQILHDFCLEFGIVKVNLRRVAYLGGDIPPLILNVLAFEDLGELAALNRANHFVPVLDLGARFVELQDQGVARVLLVLASHAESWTIFIEIRPLLKPYRVPIDRTKSRIL